MDDKAGLAWLLAIVAAGGGLLFHAQWPTINGGRKCDAAIKGQLKAPATYERVDLLALSDDGTSFSVTYDAHNSFGVPLRGKAYCNIEGGVASAYVTETE